MPDASTIHTIIVTASMGLVVVLSPEIVVLGLFMAANQVGKTIAGGFEWAIHLTGRYPEWWEGYVFEEPVRFWAAGVTGESTRDNPQRILIGPPMQKEAWGTGAVPFECIKDTITGRGVPNGLDSAIIRHGGGGDAHANNTDGNHDNGDDGNNDGNTNIRWKTQWRLTYIIYQ